MSGLRTDAFPPIVATTPTRLFVRDYEKWAGKDRDVGEWLFILYIDARILRYLSIAVPVGLGTFPYLAL